MTTISTFSAGTSKAMHSEPSWSRMRRIGGGGLCTVGFSRANVCHGDCPRDRWRVRANWIRRVNEALDDKQLVALRWSIRRGSPFGQANWAKSTARRSPIDWTSNRRYEHADARKRSPFQPTNKTKSPDHFSLEFHAGRLFTILASSITIHSNIGACLENLPRTFPTDEPSFSNHSYLKQFFSQLISSPTLVSFWALTLHFRSN